MKPDDSRSLIAFVQKHRLTLMWHEASRVCQVYNSPTKGPDAS